VRDSGLGCWRDLQEPPQSEDMEDTHLQDLPQQGHSRGELRSMSRARADTVAATAAAAAEPVQETNVVDANALLSMRTGIFLILTLNAAFADSSGPILQFIARRPSKAGDGPASLSLLSFS
jgi:hypothetical protein